MTSVPIKLLKEQLSELAERAARGEVIEVTKYSKPYIIIKAANSEGLRIGSQLGIGLQSIGAKKAKGQLFETLEEDRNDSKYYTNRQ